MPRQLHNEVAQLGRVGGRVAELRVGVPTNRREHVDEDGDVEAVVECGSVFEDPDTDESRRAIVRADNPDSRSLMRTTVRSPR